MPYRIIPETRMLYNPQLKGVHNFVPGVMALVLMLVCVMMTAISIVKEKETGTMEILLVSPFKPILVIISKAVPYLILSLVNVTSILLLSVFVLDLPINGSVLLIICGKHIVHHYLPVVRFIDFCKNPITANCNADFINGHAVAYNSF